jgi:hypothetical protein
MAGIPSGMQSEVSLIEKKQKRDLHFPGFKNLPFLPGKPAGNVSNTGRRENKLSPCPK